MKIPANKGQSGWVPTMWASWLFPLLYLFGTWSKCLDFASFKGFEQFSIKRPQERGKNLQRKNHMWKIGWFRFIWWSLYFRYLKYNWTATLWNTEISVKEEKEVSCVRSKFSSRNYGIQVVLKKGFTCLSDFKCTVSSMEDRFQRVLREWSPTEKSSLLYGGNRIIILPYLPETIFMENKTEPRPLAR